MSASPPEGARILIVDDQEANVRLLEAILRRGAPGTEVRSTTEARETLGLFTAFQPDLVLLDLHMPHVDGLTLLGQLLESIPPETYLPVLVLTADVTTEAKRQALGRGARDFLTKPFDPTEVLLRIRNLLETRALHERLREHNRTLEARVRERTRELDEARLEALEVLARAAEFRDDDTGEHAQRVGVLAGRIGEALGLGAATVELLERAAPLHDVGKIGIPDQILLKPGSLTPDEWTQMRRHTTIGAAILAGRRSPLLQLAAEIARSHHERWDGRGYPDGLAGEAIPLAARIVAVADAFDAMTHDRPYRPARTEEETWAILEAGAGTQWEARIVRALAEAMGRHRPASRGAAGGARRE